MSSAMSASRGPSCTRNRGKNPQRSAGEAAHVGFATEGPPDLIEFGAYLGVHCLEHQVLGKKRATALLAFDGSVPPDVHRPVDGLQEVEVELVLGRGVSDQ